MAKYNDVVSQAMYKTCMYYKYERLDIKLNYFVNDESRTHGLTLNIDIHIPYYKAQKCRMKSFVNYGMNKNGHQFEFPNFGGLLHIDKALQHFEMQSDLTISGIRFV